MLEIALTVLVVALIVFVAFLPLIKQLIWPQVYTFTDVAQEPEKEPTLQDMQKQIKDLTEDLAELRRQTGKSKYIRGTGPN